MRLASLLLINVLGPVMFATAQEADVKLVPLSGLKLLVERVGTISYVRCAERTPECEPLEELEIRPDFDWEALVAKGKKTKPPKKRAKGGLTVLAKANAVDQHGGIWIAALLPHDQGREADFSSPFAYALVPSFKGYRVTGDIVEALKGAQWDEAVAAKPKPKKGLRRLLD